MRNDFERFVEELPKQGFRVRFSSKGYAVIYQDGILAAVLWSFDDVSVRHTIKRLRQIGFIWPPPKRG